MASSARGHSAASSHAAWIAPTVAKMSSCILDASLGEEIQAFADQYSWSTPDTIRNSDPY
jgi:hypothetical protein